jgi:CRP-like cAMP-binding protein
MRRRRFTKGATIFSEGDGSDEAYLIRRGRVEVLKATPHGPLPLAVLHEGDVLGEMGLLDHRPRSASARVLEDVDADAVNAQEFVAMLSSDPVKSLQLLRALFERLRSLNTRFCEQSDATPTMRTIPRIKLMPLTPHVSNALPAEGLDITRFPFLIGRVPEAGEPSALRFNHLEFPDSRPHLLSLHHLALDLAPDGVLVRDRGSRHGTAVNGSRIGAGGAVDVAPLRGGENEVVAGVWQLPAARHSSPFRWRVIVQ